MKTLLFTTLVALALLKVVIMPSTANAAAPELYTTPVYSSANLSCYFRFSNNLNDSAPNAVCGTISGSPSYTTGEFGQAVACPGTTAYSTAGNFPNNGTGVLSMSGWIYVPSNPSNYVRAFGISGSGNDSFILRINNTNHWEFVLQNIGSGGGNIDSPSTITTGAWQFLGAVYDGSTGWLYLNGTAVASSSASGNFSVTPQPFTICGSGGGYENFGGNIDDVQVSNIGVSSTTLYDLYNGFPSPINPPLMYSYFINEN
jgi:hypothetical protein